MVDENSHLRPMNALGAFQITTADENGQLRCRAMTLRGRNHPNTGAMVFVALVTQLASRTREKG